MLDSVWLIVFIYIVFFAEFPTFSPWLHSISPLQSNERTNNSLGQGLDAAGGGALPFSGDRSGDGAFGFA